MVGLRELMDAVAALQHASIDLQNAAAQHEKALGVLVGLLSKWVPADDPRGTNNLYRPR